jgi:CubicO group peptidase (beta-lactamase class C family)
MQSLIPLFFLLLTCTCADWSKIDKLMTESINTRVFPGAAIAIANKTHILYQKGYGHLSYGPDIYSLQVQFDTKYDMASVTKVMATTFDVMNAVGGGRMKVDDLVVKYIPNYDTNKKGNTTIKNLLLHNAGLPFDYVGELPKTQD